MKPRHYQLKAEQAFINWFAAGKNKPLIVLPTGTGKSVVAARICQRVLRNDPYARVLVAADRKELVQQNYNKMLSVWPDAPAGIVSSGLNRKDFCAQILFGGIQTMHKNATKIGRVDLMIVDEAQGIQPKGVGMWNNFAEDLKAINPNFCMGGMTATPFRTTAGTLIGGKSPQFDGICYEYKITDAIKEGYLVEVKTPQKEITRLSAKGVKKRGGEFISKELEQAVATDELTAKCCEEIMEHGKDRKTWLIFASGNSHAHKIHEYLKARGLIGHVVTDDTHKKSRDLAVRQLVDGQCQYIVNNMILTTGFDCPRLDLIACLRPTQSAGLWVQICGRGTRLYPNKTDCLLLDFGRNIDRHGPIDQISGSNYIERETKGDAPIKNCPSCFEVIHAAARICPACDFHMPQNDLNLTKRASRGAVLSTQNEPIEIAVLHMELSRNKGKGGKRDTLRVKYTTPLGAISEFICYDHPAQSVAYQKAVQWGGAMESVEDALSKTWGMPKTIVVKKEGKYYSVLRRHMN